MHEKNYSSRDITKMGGGGGGTLSVTCPQGAKYAVTPPVLIEIAKSSR